MIASLLAGFTSSMALIVAIGSQNAFVLRQGLRREHVLAVVLTCALSDALLITVGVGGLGAAVAAAPGLLTAIRWGGAAFLLGYAVLAARRALRPGTLAARDGHGSTLRATMLACLAFTFLNPHVYLDTVLLLGGLASQQQFRWVFAAGAALASAVWFTGLGAGAHRLAPVLARPLTWRVLDGVIAVTMTAIALGLLLS
ncbi:LysE/ArgO family amino acid transporter [Catellatospora tritici]|uniref:LysE/ArgO family amino acid transporter n=1 Tax=Catellatospora tritici TaxID=2851566 RepID=UPI001C2DAFB5|nr:LysE family transporter [Catellatospora tritici]MBV1853168.1 LysE family transporter [Catellatospora tritici]